MKINPDDLIGTLKSIANYYSITPCVNVTLRGTSVTDASQFADLETVLSQATHIAIANTSSPTRVLVVVTSQLWEARELENTFVSLRSRGIRVTYGLSHDGKYQHIAVSQAR